SLLTATTHVMVAGTDADPIAVPALTTTLDIAGTVIGTLTMSVGDAAIATVISTTTAVGDATGKYPIDRTSRNRTSQEEGLAPARRKQRGQAPLPDLFSFAIVPWFEVLHPQITQIL